MPLLRSQKEAFVNDLIIELKESRISIIFAYKQLNSKANLELRDRAFDQGAKIKMVSNNLLTLVLKGINQTLDLPQKQLAVAYGFDDEITAAKLLSDFARSTDSLEIIAGWIDRKFFSSADVKILAQLPSKDILLGQVIGRLSGVIQGLVYGLNHPLQKFVYVISAVEQSKK